MSKIFQEVGKLDPSKSSFDLSYNHRFNCDMGQMIPVMYQECVPGDIFDISNQSLVRAQPMIYPIIDNITQKIRYFFVPTRIIYDKWEEFITGQKKGVIPPEEFTEPQPEWKPTLNGKYTLWDYFGLPIGEDPKGAYPLPYPKRAYNLIYNEYYRDENLQELVDLDQENVLYANWEKDYFTSALPFRQKGTAPSIPLTGYGKAIFQEPFIGYWNNTSDSKEVFSDTFTEGELGLIGHIGMATDEDSKALLKAFNQNKVDLSNVGTINVSDLRDITQLQKWLERNARAGTRYVEFLNAHFGIAPDDKTLQRPEYLGGTGNTIPISEVLQTSESSELSPQGNLAGHGLAVNEGHVTKYRVEEYGWIIGIMTIAPAVAYQQGINRTLLRKSRLEQFYPEFVNLSEQAIIEAEIMAINNEEDNQEIFGYTGMYDEMRIRQSITSGDLRDKLDYICTTRKFATRPALNSDFITCKPDKHIFAVQDEPGFIVNVYNQIHAIRPLPFISEPGLLDHH